MATDPVEKYGPDGIIKRNKPLLGAFGTSNLLTAFGYEAYTGSGTNYFQDLVKSKAGLYLVVVAGTSHDAAAHENGVYLVALDTCINPPYCGGSVLNTGSSQYNIWNGASRSDAGKSVETEPRKITVKMIFNSPSMCTGTCSAVYMNDDGQIGFGGAYPGGTIYITHLIGADGGTVSNWGAI
jgi:hypothetical protein